MSEFKFVHNITAFNLQNAYSLAVSADLAYKKESIIKEKVLGEWKFNVCEFLEEKDDDTQLFIMANDNIIVVAFRGSESNIEDWRKNFTFPLVDGPFGGKVHKGFYSGVNKVWKELKSTIRDFKENGQKSLWFTGHSLGAALATLAVAKLRTDDQPVDGLYTFGQPRTGDRNFAKNFNSDFKSYAFRFVNNNDIVSRIPPRALQFSHIGTFKYFTEKGTLVDDIGWWNRFLDRLNGRVESIFKDGSKDYTDGIVDHRMDNYIRLINKAIVSQHGRARTKKE